GNHESECCAKLASCRPHGLTLGWLRPCIRSKGPVLVSDWSAVMSPLALSHRLFIAIVLAIAVARPALATEEASKVRILLVIDTEGRNAAKLGTVHDREHLQAAFAKALKRDQPAYTFDILEGDAASPKSVLDYYQNLKSGRDETLFFWYTGHGHMNK